MATTKPMQPVAGGERPTSQFAGMSRSQLYEVMSQMKNLIEQNQQQARQILIDNPALTKSLFQAQIMLGMVRPPQKMPNIQQTPSHHPQQPAQAVLQSKVLASQTLPMEPLPLGQVTSQPTISARHHFQSQGSVAAQPLLISPSNFHSQSTASQSIPSTQAKGPLNAQLPVSFPQNSQMHNLPPPSLHSLQHSFQSHVPMASNLPQHSVQSGGMMHQPLQPPLPPQPRPPSMHPFQHQLLSQVPHNLSFQQSNAPPQHLSQPIFQSSHPTSFSQAQPSLAHQPPSQHVYQAMSHMGPEFTNPGATPMQVDTGVSWHPGPLDNTIGGLQFPGQPSLPSGQMGPGPGGQPPRPPQLTNDMEKALLQQVMSLTPEQINLLPPEQRHQVLQLQQMMR